ncbi:helix-turn-helix domain-containing protein [Agrobacterium arsenijevicii]|uniref:helix-turn-helix domain-containing protein n=1 Tax=Agrobacterium arsenijevicii TaxID=1585697 RepID=UPI0011123429
MAEYQSLNEAEICSLSDRVSDAMRDLHCSASELASRAGVSQPMVHRILHGQIRKSTPNIKRLMLYIRIATGVGESADLRRLDDAVLGYLSAGGNLDDLRSIIIACTRTRERVA